MAKTATPKKRPSPTYLPMGADPETLVRLDLRWKLWFERLHKNVVRARIPGEPPFPKVGDGRFILFLAAKGGMALAHELGVKTPPPDLDGDDD